MRSISQRASIWQAKVLVNFMFQQDQHSPVGSVESLLIIGPAPFGLKRTKARAKAKAAAGPSTTFGAKSAPNSAQDDRSVGGAILFRAGRQAVWSPQRTPEEHRQGDLYLTVGGL